MTKRLFTEIVAGLEDAAAIARGEHVPGTVIHYPTKVAGKVKLPKACRPLNRLKVKATKAKSRKR